MFPPFLTSRPAASRRNREMMAGSGKGRPIGPEATREGFVEGSEKCEATDMARETGEPGETLPKVDERWLSRYS